MYKEFYDIIITGGGPAGSLAGWFAAEKGASVVILEKDRDIGYPVRCAEGISENNLKLYLEPSPEWQGQRIEYSRFISPSGKNIRVGTKIKGYILQRKIFDYELSKIAASYGAEVFTKSYVKGLIREGDNIKGVIVKHLNDEYKIFGKIIIGADGVESRIGKWAGINTVCSLEDIDTCVQATVSNIDIEEKACHFYFGKNVAPGGYAWIFPKGKGCANIGLGIRGVNAGVKSPVKFLKEFLKNNFPGGSVHTIIGGGVPCSGGLKKIVHKNVMLVGDAAHQTNPMSGGGLAYAMAAGKLAGTVAAEAVINGKNIEKYIVKYQKEWNKKWGKEIKSFYRIKQRLNNFSDENFEKIAEILEKIKPEEITLRKLFLEAFKSYPKLLVEILKVIR